MDLLFYEKCKYRFVTFLYAIFWAFIIAHGAQWALGVCDITPNVYWFKGGFLFLTLLFWAPWRKCRLPAKNQGNNDLFPE